MKYINVSLTNILHACPLASRGFHAKVCLPHDRTI